VGHPITLADILVSSISNDNLTAATSQLRRLRQQLCLVSFHFTEKKEEGVKKKTDIAALLLAFA
jgi:hypothetical protein